MKYFILPLFFLSSCATSIRDEDCKRNIRDVGVQDSSRGLDSSMFQTYDSICQWKNSAQQKELYLQGHEEGTKAYCTRRQGKLVAESGRPFPRQCKSYNDFSVGYSEGKKKGLPKKASQ